MRKLVNKKFNHFHYIALAITLLFLLCSVFIYKNSFIRILESFKDIWTSFQYYIAKLVSIMQDAEFDSSSVTVTVTDVSKVDYSFVFPLNFEEFKAKLSATFSLFFTLENFTLYLASSTKTMILIYTIFVFFVLVLTLIRFYIDYLLDNYNNDYVVDSKAVIFIKKIETACVPIKNYLKRLFKFFFSSVYVKIWLLIWLYNLNVFTIIIEFFAYLIYFLLSFDIATLYIEVYKLFFDLTIMFNGLPLIVWVIIAVAILMVIRRKMAFDKLEHLEAYNTGFVKSLPTLNLFYGWMGAGKGQIMTDIVLTKVKTYRSDTKETMFKYDLMFPNFPWVLFEKKIQELKEKHIVFDLARLERYINARKRLFDNLIKMNNYNGAKRVLFGYDILKYPLEFDNKMYMVSIFDALKEYGMAYFIYVTAELIISNYPIRSDGIMSDIGNFPLWDYNFFNRNSKDLDSISTYGKILDQDIMRKGKKMVEDNPFADTLEFGVPVFAELDKERGNQFATQEMKRSAEEVNQKNDLFNYGLKMDRHPSTVDFKHYLNIYFDLQRLGSTNADLQECGQHIGIGPKDSALLTMPFFFVEEVIFGVLGAKFESFYYDYRFARSDSTILVYLLKKCCSRFINYYNNTYNLFGYDEYKLLVEDSVTKQNKVHKYYLSYKKSRSKRYTTDSFVDCFRKATLKKNKGMVDYPAYKGVKATDEELKMQNSYFYNDLSNMFSFGAKAEPKEPEAPNETGRL